MGAMTSQITSLTIFNSTVYLGADQRNHQGSASQVFVRGIHRWLMNSSHNWPVTRKIFPFDDVIMHWDSRSVALSGHGNSFEDKVLDGIYEGESRSWFYTMEYVPLTLQTIMYSDTFHKAVIMFRCVNTRLQFGEGGSRIPSVELPARKKTIVLFSGKHCDSIHLLGNIPRLFRRR